MSIRSYFRAAVVFIGLLVGLLVAFPALIAGARADAAPTIAPFTTAHLLLRGTVSAQGQELPVQGEGELDATRGASHLTIGLLGATFETIVVDGRSYSRNALTGRWEYTEGPQANGFNPAQLAPYDPATIRAAGSNFTRIGAEPIAGTPTTHWRADVDVSRLFGFSAGTGGAGFTTSTATMDLWIGDTDSRLRQLVLDAQGTTRDASGVASPFKQALTLTFDGFGASVAIVAPPGAVVAATPVALAVGRAATPGPPGGATIGLPIARASVAVAVNPTATAPPLENVSPSPAPSATAANSRLIVRVVAASSLVVLVVVGAVAARQRQTRERQLD